MREQWVKRYCFQLTMFHFFPRGVKKYESLLCQKTQQSQSLVSELQNDVFETKQIFLTQDR